MRKLFGKDAASSSKGAEPGRTPRHSSGWKELVKHLRSQESLRVLDIGPTSSTNINYITGLGHSIYMANLIEEAMKPEWQIAREPGEPPQLDPELFLRSNLNFSGRTFDVVILWDTIDYLPKQLVAPVIDRIHEVMAPGGQMLAFFHVKQLNEGLLRYHLTDTDQVEMQKAGDHPLIQIHNNRQIEQLLAKFSSYRFFLAKDNLREVIANR